MAADRQEFDIGASLLGLYKDLPYVKKLGYIPCEPGGRLIVWAVVEGSDGDSDDDELGYHLAAVRKAREFRDMMPAGMRGEYEVVPIVNDPDEGALSYFRTMTAVIDR